MASVAAAAAPRRWLAFSALGGLLSALALGVAHAPIGIPLVATLGGLVFGAALLRAEAGLVILIVSMLFSPEISVGGLGGSGLEGSRFVILRTEDLLLLLVGIAWMARIAIHKDLGAVRRTRLNLAIAAYAVACLVSTLAGIEAGRVRPMTGMLYIIKYVEYFAIFFMTVNYVRAEADLRRLLAAVLATGALITLFASVQIPSGVRPTAPFEGAEGEPNTLGGYLVLIFSVSVAIALTVPEARWKRSCGLLAAGTLPPLLATLSRSSWLAFIVSLAVLLALSPARRRLAAAAFVVVIVLAAVRPGRIEERVLYTIRGHEQGSLPLGPVRLDPSSSARLSSWGAALRGVTEHPLLGWGVTGYGFLDAQYFRVLVEIGLAGFAAFLSLLAATGLMFRRALLSADPLHRALGLGMTAGLAGLLAHAVGTNTFLLIRIMEPFWLLTGLVTAALHLEGRP